MKLSQKVKEKLRRREEERASFDEALKTLDVPSPKEQEDIAQSTALEIVQKIKSGEFTAEKVMITQCLRAKEATRLYNCNTEELFLQAIEKAKAADEQLKVSKAACGMFHGLPISVKDHVDVEGTDSTCGLKANLFKAAEENAAFVQAMIEEGAIPFVKSNVPQLLMVPETMNNIYGKTLNPWNTDRGPGGSSGGEAVLVSTGASFLGIGTDIGGSIRIPAMFCGVFGFKPTPERVSPLGQVDPVKGGESGQQTIKSVIGPIGRSVDDLIAVCKCIWKRDSQMYVRDGYLAPAFYDEDTFHQGSKRIGYYVNDGWFDTAPGIKRAVLEAKSALESKGFTLVPFEIPNPEKMVQLYAGVLSSDGNLKNFTRALEGESLLKEYNSIKSIADIPAFIRPFLSSVLRVIGEKRKAALLIASKKKSVLGHWDFVSEMTKYRREFLEKMKEADVEALLGPGLALPAIPHGESKDLLMGVSGTFLYNALHFPVGAVPITLVKEGETNYTFSLAKDSWAKIAAKTLKGSEGLPCGVQIITPPWKDERCLHIMKALEESGATLPTERLPFVETVTS